MLYNGPKCRLCRREGKKLFLKGDRCNTQKCAFLRKPEVPGKYGKNTMGKKTEYHGQLRAKQAGKRTFNLTEKQFKKYYTEANRRDGNTGENFILQLESRLDNAVYRAGFTASRNQARQMVSHGFFTVNDKRASTASIQLKVGDVIKVKKNDSQFFAGIVKQKDNSPKWLKVDLAKLTAEVVAIPEIMECEQIDTQTIVEFYSR
ncbi:30S ribosomal protein S4 [Candidatus Gracilibacteria bacterium]|nr:30S ribosomal protein S4 [Candidatus Gracilibacteria bacterium]MCF7897124.1 30S ribosomal protein S4 [Candidatus Gracilibacteria bacterium]